ncbi:hypothetical protein B0H11DRAFT_640293, partial [Mycena galericulata]
MRINYLLLATCSQMIHPLFTLASPTSLSPFLKRTEGSNDLTALHPGLHPDDDISDLNNLKAKVQSALYYAASPESDVQGAALMQLTHKYPAVSPERSHFISSISCNAASDTIAVTFKDRTSFRTASEDWQTHRTGFFIISYVAGCGPGTDSSERSFHFVSKIVTASERDLRIVCQMTTVPIEQTVHEDQEIKVNVATYKRDDPKRPLAHDSSGSTTITRRETTFFKVLKFVASLSPLPFGGLAVDAVGNLKIDEHPSKTATFSTQDVKPYDAKFEKDNDSYLLYTYKPGSSSSKTSRQNDNAPMAGGSGQDMSNSTGTNNSTDTKNSTSTTTKKIEFFCVDCHVTVTVRFAGNFVGTFKDGFTEANMQLDADLTLKLVLGLKATCEPLRFHRPGPFSLNT